MKFIIQFWSTLYAKLKLRAHVRRRAEYGKIGILHIRKILEKSELVDPRPTVTFFHTPPHQLHFLMQRSRARFYPRGTLQIVAPWHHKPLPAKAPLPWITPTPSEHLYNIVMNDDIKNLLCFLFVILVGLGFMSLFFLSIKDSPRKNDKIEVENVPVFHSNPDGTIDTYFYPVIH